MLRNISELGLWDIAHYWHDISPNHKHAKLPLKVEKTLRALAQAASGGLYFRCYQDSLYYHAFHEQAWAVRSVATIFQRKLKRVYQGNYHNKKFLNSLTMTRTAIAKWCRITRTPPPDFWFEPDDPLLTRDIEQLDTFAALTGHGAFTAFPLFNPKEDVPGAGQGDSQATINPSAFNDLEIPVSEKAIREEISRLGRKNALSRYSKQHELKRQFIRYFHEDPSRKRARAARLFFTKLTIEQKKCLVPTYLEQDAEEGVKKAIRTLTGALAEYKSGKPSPWLEGFTV